MILTRKPALLLLFSIYHQRLQGTEALQHPGHGCSDVEGRSPLRPKMMDGKNEMELWFLGLTTNGHEGTRISGQIDHKGPAQKVEPQCPHRAEVCARKMDTRRSQCGRFLQQVRGRYQRVRIFVAILVTMATLLLSVVTRYGKP